MTVEKPEAVIAVIIPCYRVGQSVKAVVEGIGLEVTRIYIVDDACPMSVADFVRNNISDPRVTVVKHPENMGVGAATVTGMNRALEDGATILVKIDGDGQMSPALIPALIEPLIEGRADYTKGNRFIHAQPLSSMPSHRFLGNILTSLFAKLSTGYWNVFDVTNGFVAIHASVYGLLPKERIAKRFFFETDMLYHLYMVGAVVEDVPVPAVYGEEKSNLNMLNNLFPFLTGHLKNFFSRLFFVYFVRDFSIISLMLVAGILLSLFGVIFGSFGWRQSIVSGIPATAGSVMLSALPILIGIQMLIGFLLHDSARHPTRPIHPVAKSLATQ